MTEKFDSNYDQDASKKFGSNPPTNPHWTSPQGQGIQPPTAPLTLSGAYPAPLPPSGTYVGPNLQPTNQMPQRDRLVESARGSPCLIIFGVFLTIKGIIMMSIASKFDVDWIKPPRTNVLRIIGPIELGIGIIFILISCILIATAKTRTASNGQNHLYNASNFGGSRPIVYGGNYNGSDHTILAIGHENSNCLQGHDHLSFTVDSPPSYDSVTATCDASSSTTTDASPSTTTD